MPFELMRAPSGRLLQASNCNAELGPSNLPCIALKLIKFHPVVLRVCCSQHLPRVNAN
jgi:hypothetical protein